MTSANDRARWLLLAYLPGAIFLGAILAWPLWAGLRALGLDPAFEEVALRLMELAALLLLIPVLDRTGGNSADAWGYRGPRAALAREAGRGFLVGVAMLLVPALILIALGARDPRVLTPAVVGIAVAKSLLTAVAVALLEETWFRGGLTSLVQRAFGWTWGIGAVAMLYAALHFLDPLPVPAPEVSLFSGFAVAADAFGGLTIDDAGSALTLLTAGLVLGLLRARTGRIAWCIGMHAGWVLVIQTVRRLTELDATDPQSALVGAYDGVIGWLAAMVFVATLLTVLLMRHRTS